MRKMSGKVDKSNTHNEFLIIFRSLFKEELLQTKKIFEFFYILAIEEIG